MLTFLYNTNSCPKLTENVISRQYLQKMSLFISTVPLHLIRASRHKFLHHCKCAFTHAQQIQPANNRPIVKPPHTCVLHPALLFSCSFLPKKKCCRLQNKQINVRFLLTSLTEFPILSHITRRIQYSSESGTQLTFEIDHCEK